MEKGCRVNRGPLGALDSFEGSMCGISHKMSRRKVYSGFNTVFLSLLLLAAGVGFPAACFWR